MANLDAVVIEAGPNGAGCRHRDRARWGVGARPRWPRRNRGRHPDGRTNSFPVSSTTFARLAVRWALCRRLSASYPFLRRTFAPAFAAHPLDGQPAVLLRRSTAGTARLLGIDADAYVLCWRAITGGVADVHQLLLRPAARWIPYATRNPRRFPCSAATPPEAAVRGMRGYDAAREEDDPNPRRRRAGRPL